VYWFPKINLSTQIFQRNSSNSHRHRFFVALPLAARE
jgi:hypothetical protein